MIKKQKSYYQLFFWLEKLAFFLLIGFFLSLYFHRIISFNQDLGRHLKLGQIILKQKNIPKTNLFSFTYPNFPFINHHWLSEVIFYIFASLFTLNSLIFLKIIFNGLAFFLLLSLAKKRSNAIVSLSLGFLLLLLFKQRTEIRPEIFSYFFFSFYLIILSLPKIFKKYFYLLALIQVLWVNIHIYFFLGPVLLSFYLLNHLILAKLKKKKLELKIFLALFLSFFSCLFNPNFLKGALYPLFVFKNYGYRVVENQSFFYMSHYLKRIYDPYFLLIFLFCFLTFILTLKKQSFYSLSLFIFFSIFAFSAIRNIPVFALAVFIPASRNLALILKKTAKKISQTTIINFKLFFYFLFIPLISILIFKNISNQAYLAKFSSKRFGLGKAAGAGKGTDFIKINKIKGPVFNNFDIGSFLIYKLYPQYQVFVDGRPEAYPFQFFQKTYIPMQLNWQKWLKAEKKYHFNFIFFSHTDITPWATTFLKKIIQDKSWQLIYLDDYVIIFIKNKPANKTLISQFAINKNNFSYSCQKQIDCYARIKRIFNIINFPKNKLNL